LELMIQVVRKQEEHNETIYWLDRILAINSSYFEYSLMKANVFRQTGELHRAQEELEAALSVEPNNKSLLIAKVEVSYELKDLKNLYSALSALLNLSPLDIEVLEKGAQALYEFEKYTEALKVIERHSDLGGSQSLEVLEIRMNSLKALGRYTEALDISERLLKLKPLNVQFIRAQAELLFQLDKYQDALNTLENLLAAELNSPSPNHLENVSYALFTMQEQKDAIFVNRQILANAGPKGDITAHKRIIISSSQINNHTTTLLESEKYLQRYPADLSILTYKLLAQMGLEQNENAVATLKEIESLVDLSNAAIYELLIELEHSISAGLSKDFLRLIRVLKTIAQPH